MVANISIYSENTILPIVFFIIVRIVNNTVNNTRVRDKKTIQKVGNLANTLYLYSCKSNSYKIYKR